MNGTTHGRRLELTVIALAGAMGVGALLGHPIAANAQSTQEKTTMSPEQVLSRKQLTIAPIAAATAVGDMHRLHIALNHGLDAGLTISDAKEILVQLYAYAGFPRSLNALGELMKVLEARKQRGVKDAPGRDPGRIPAGQELLALGEANQTKLSGGPVKGPVFEFAPAIDETPVRKNHDGRVLADGMTTAPG